LSIKRPSVLERQKSTNSRARYYSAIIVAKHYIFEKEASMEIKGINAATGEEFEAEADGIGDNFVQFMSDFEISEDKVKRLIDNLDISADAKALLFSLSKVTIRAGEFIIKIGRKIIDFACVMFKEYPSTAFGAILGAFIGLLISAIPILGLALGPLLTPILIAVGIVGGVAEDIKDKDLVRKITAVHEKFSPLKTC